MVYCAYDGEGQQSAQETAHAGRISVERRSALASPVQEPRKGSLGGRFLQESAPLLAAAL